MNRKSAGRTPTAGDRPTGPTKRSHRSTISLAPELRSRLEARGARSDKGHGPNNYTRHLSRTLELFDSLLEKSDPRRTRDMPKDHYDLVVDVLTDPLVLESFRIARLGDYLFELPSFQTRVGELALDPAAFRDRINDYPFAEKLHLVQAAQVHHAPGNSR